jgi:hypothetical protein
MTETDGTSVQAPGDGVNKAEASADGMRKRKSVRRGSVSLEKGAFEVEAEAVNDLNPTRAKGWEHWKNCGMPQRITQVKDGKKTTHLAEPGEQADKDNHETKDLYSIWATSAFSSRNGGDFGEFGLGIGLYFQTLLCMAFVSLICFLVILPGMITFATSEKYSNGQSGWDRQGEQVQWLQVGSAACTENLTVFMSEVYGPNIGLGPVDERQEGLPEQSWNQYHRIMGTYLKNTCVLPTHVGYVTFIAAGLFFVFIMGFSYAVDRFVVVMDEGVQTAQDYSSTGSAARRTRL